MDDVIQPRTRVIFHIETLGSISIDTSGLMFVKRILMMVLLMVMMKIAQYLLTMMIVSLTIYIFSLKYVDL